MTDRLLEICNRTREHVAACKATAPLSTLEERIKIAGVTRGFHSALKTTHARGDISLISEIKKASPSKGLIREDFNPAQHAQDYAAAGASCLSVLTDKPYFQGDDTFLIEARSACSLPVLRKDFMVDTYQIAEARALGADCILIIMAALEDALAKEIEDAAHSYGMDVLIEVHDAEEMERACTHLSSALLGINNRNLKTLEVSLETGKDLAKRAPADKTLICESGISTHAEIQEMLTHGFHGFLVGESLMRQQDLASATRTLLGK